jgi:hypothetical protein
MEIFDFWKFNNVEVKEQYQVGLHLSETWMIDADISWAWESIREKMSTLATESLGY